MTLKTNTLEAVMRKMVFTIGVIGLMIAGALPVMAETVAEIDRIRPDKLEMVGFELDKTAEVEIEAVGIRQRHGNDLIAYAWLLDSDTRQVVWAMKERSTDRVGKVSGLRRAEKITALDAGKYELYYFAGRNQYGNISIRGTGDVISLLGDWFSDDDDRYDSDDYDDLTKDCFVRITSAELSAGDINEFEVTGNLPNALIRLTQLGDDVYERQAFKLSKPASIRIYSVVEHPRGNKSAADHGWIVDAVSGERVWDVDRWGTERAGGGSKNRVFNDEVHLKAGEYILHFVTDDSHSFDEFNVAPPYDPMNWGITLLPGTDFDPSSFSLSELPESAEPVIDLTRARDNDNLEQPFRVDKDITVRVYALGEGSYLDASLVDYGWIEDASSGRMVWEMEYRDTDHAGGADKNRMFDGRVKLPAGDYIAYYSTDGSHSYRDWNSSAPYDKIAWGMAIYVLNADDKSSIQAIDRTDMKRNTNLLVSMTRIRDDERRRERFTLDRETTVLIRALGEGTSGRMNDYGWIVDDKTGRTVWKMAYRKTDHAGGADKNRIEVDEITLDAGTYEVIFESDGSHSFNDWNARRPRNPEDWGITVSVIP